MLRMAGSAPAINVLSDRASHPGRPMNIQDTASARSAYAIGQPALRKEDPKLLRGEGRYTDDINLPDQAHAFILRSSMAHGRIKSIDTAAAKAMPGVLAVYTGADLAAMNLPIEKIRVLTGNVGGSFGMKAGLYPEYIGIMHAARALGRPVKWTEERSQSFLSDQAGRDHEVTGELALDKDGHFLALRLTATPTWAPIRRMSRRMIAALNIGKNAVGVYRTPLIETSRALRRHQHLADGPYRGAGRPEGNYVMERLIDAAAVELGIDPRSCASATTSAEQFPHTAPNGMVYDSGDFGAVLDRALAAGDWKGFERRKAERRPGQAARPRPRLQFLEVTAPRSRRWAACASRPMAASPSSPARSTTARATRRPSRRCCPRARHSVRADPPAAGRQRRAARRRRHRRLALDDDERLGDHACRRQGDRERQGDRGVRARGRRRGYRVHAARSASSAPIARSACSSSRPSCAPACAAGRRRRASTSAMSTAPCPRPSPMAATSPRSRSIPTPA
jgi:hypothetical protein